MQSEIYSGEYKMKTYYIIIGLLLTGMCVFIAAAVAGQSDVPVKSEIDKAAYLARTGNIKEAENILQPLLTQDSTAFDAAYELGLIYYEINETEKCIKYFKDALAKAPLQPPSGKLQQAVELAKSGKTDDAEKILLSLLSGEATAVRARYELGLIYENRNDLNNAATTLRDALVLLVGKTATYKGIRSCQKCHIKEYISWKKTKMASTFEVLKPGQAIETKTKFKLDPQKDYTTDTKCLECHTTGFRMPGGYKIPEKGDLEAAKHAQENEGITCEGCHGPGSKYIPIHENALMKKQKYTLDELYQAGQYKIDIRDCTTCHNLRNPTSGPNYHFDFDKYKNEDTHQNYPLKYRQE